MNTPVCDFVRRYAESESLRLHMPGHKGKSFLGFEKYDITEIDGADSLFEAEGILRESEENASGLFGTQKTYYSAEGSSLCIRAMLYLAALYAKANGRRPVILAGRNAHKTFITAAGPLELDIKWIYPEEGESYLSCCSNEAKIEGILKKLRPAAVYITSPDYLGGICDIKKISALCKKYGALLLTDNAHGAYLKFLPQSMHPIDLGADICCDSAHKTLPVLTGGAYLHFSKSAPRYLAEKGRQALSLFASTSPSYLILQSLDLANKYLADGYREKLALFINQAARLKERLQPKFELCGNEPLKLTLKAKSAGLSGKELSAELRKTGIETEFSDPDFTVMMLTPETGADGLLRLEQALNAVLTKPPIEEKPPFIFPAESVMTAREAIFAESETVTVKDSLGRILASPSVGCPPAVPIAVCGERINESAVKAFEYYSVENVVVVK